MASVFNLSQCKGFIFLPASTGTGPGEARGPAEPPPGGAGGGGAPGSLPAGGAGGGGAAGPPEGRGGGTTGGCGGAGTEFRLADPSVEAAGVGCASGAAAKFLGSDGNLGGSNGFS